MGEARRRPVALSPEKPARGRTGGRVYAARLKRGYLTGEKNAPFCIARDARVGPARICIYIYIYIYNRGIRAAELMPGDASGIGTGDWNRGIGTGDKAAPFCIARDGRVGPARVCTQVCWTGDLFSFTLLQLFYFYVNRAKNARDSPLLRFLPGTGGLINSPGQKTGVRYGGASRPPGTGKPGKPARAEYFVESPEKPARGTDFYKHGRRVEL